MAKKEPKTKPTPVSPKKYVAAVENEQKRKDAEWLMQMMAEVTGEPPKMWGPSIIGFGTYHYVYESGREGDTMITGFSPRKAAISIYLISGVAREAELLGQLGKYKTGKSCLYVKRLSDVNTDVLRELVASSVEKVRGEDIIY